MEIIAWLRSLWPVPPSQQEGSFERWRKWVVHILFLIIAVLIFPAMAGLAIPNLWAEAHYVLIGVYGLFYGLALFHVLTKGRGLLARRPFCLLSFYVIAIPHFIYMGPHYPRSVWLIVCVVCAAFLYGTRGAVAATFANAIILTTLHLTMSPEKQAWAEVLKTSPQIWISHIVYLSLLSLGIDLEAANADIAAEIAERKEIELKLREKDHELYSIITHTPDIIYRLNPDGRIVFISEAVARYGYSAFELKTSESTLFMGSQ